MWSPSWPRQKAMVYVRGGFWAFGPSSITLSQVSKNLPLLTAPISSMRHCGGQTSTAYGAPMTTPSPAVEATIEMSYIPPAFPLFRFTSSVRLPTSFWLCQYGRLSRLTSGGCPAATAADCLASNWGEPGIDCHSTFWPPFCLPHSTKVLPTASSVTVFQFAENQTLKTPA